MIDGEFRVHVSIFGYSPTDIPPLDAFHRIARIAQAASELGFDGLYSGQHFLSRDHHIFQPIPALARLSGTLRDDMDLIVTQILSLSQPVRLAEELAALDCFTSGRTILLGVLGYADHEFSALGVPREERASRFEEACTAIRLLFREPVVDHAGRHISLSAVGMNPRPAYPPAIWVGADGAAGVRRAARLGDAWAMATHLDGLELRRKLQSFQAVRREWGLPPATAVPLGRIALVATTDEEAYRRARPYIERRWGIYQSVDQASEMDDPSDFREAPQEALGDRFLVGSPETVARKVLSYRRALGVTDLSLVSLLPGLDTEVVLESLELFAQEVLPRIEDAWGSP